VRGSYFPLEKIPLEVFEDELKYRFYLKITDLGEKNIALLLKYTSKVKNLKTQEMHSLHIEQQKSFIVNTVPPFSITHKVTQPNKLADLSQQKSRIPKVEIGELIWVNLLVHSLSIPVDICGVTFHLEES